MRFYLILLIVQLGLVGCGIDDSQTAIEAAELRVSKSLPMVLDAYRNDIGHYPSTKESWAALIRQGAEKGWDGPYIPEAPLDPWGQEIEYECINENGSERYIIRSLGPDGVLSDDDIVFSDRRVLLEGA